MFAVDSATYTRMETAEYAGCGRFAFDFGWEQSPQRPKNESYESAVVSRLHTQVNLE